MYSLDWFSRVVFVSILSWCCGVVCFFTVVFLANGHLPPRGDVIAMIGISLLASALVLPTIHLPAMIILRKTLGTLRPAFIFGAVGALAGIVCTTFSIWMFSTSASDLVRAVFSAIGLFFSVLFITEGLIFGIGFVWACRRSAS
jgi:hypothetical protein